MGDPGSVVGFISLGLTVCQGLASYVRECKNWNREITELEAEIGGLKVHLENLSVTLTDAKALGTLPLSEQSKITRRSIDVCEQAIIDLDLTLKNARGASLPGTSQRLKRTVNRGLYPFRRPTIQDLLSKVRGLQDNLHTALISLQITLDIDNNAQLTSVAKSASDITLLASQTFKAAEHLEQRHDYSDDLLLSLTRQVAQMELAISHFTTKTSPEPAALQSLLDSQQQMAPGVHSLVSRRPSQYRQNRMRPLCRTQPTSQSSRLGPKQKTKTLQTRFTVCNRLVQFFVQASLNITTGAGGFSISPNLVFRAIVSDSPAFRVVREANMARPVGRFREREDFSYLIKETHVKLVRLFEEGDASPTDMDPGGNTALHHLATFVGLKIGVDNDACIQAAREMFIDLGSRNMLIDQPNNLGQTIGDQLVRALSNSPGCRWQVKNKETLPLSVLDIFPPIMNGGGYLTCNNMISKMFYFGLDRWRSVNQSAIEIMQEVVERRDGDFNVPVALEPLVKRDTRLLISLLADASFDVLPYVDRYIYWPSGLHTLLRAGAQPPRDALHEACGSNLTDAVRLLLSSKQFYIGPAELLLVGVWSNRQIMQMVVDSFADQTKELQRLVELHFSRSEKQQLKVSSQGTFGFSAGKAYRLLQEKGVHIGFSIGGVSSEEMGDWLLYAHVGHSRDMADILWSSGFQGINEVDDEGFTSLMRCSSLAFADWLICHGANIHYRREGSPALHYLVERIHSQAEYRLSERMDKLSKVDLRCWRLIFEDNCQDDCDCPCSPNGCFAVTRFIQHFVYDRLDAYNHLDLEENIRILIRTMPYKLVKSFGTHAAAIIRVFTFEKLEIPHICNHRGRKGPEEIQDILDEHADQIRLLDILDTEFNDMYQESGDSLLQFLGTTWKEEIDYELSTYHPPTQEEIDRVRELGVILDDIVFCPGGGRELDRDKDVGKTQAGQEAKREGRHSGRRARRRKVGRGMRRGLIFQ